MCTEQLTKKQSTVRESNFEMLRIVAILSIITYHICLYGIRYQLTDATSIAQMNNGFFEHPQLYWQLLLIQLFLPFGVMGNSVFIMLSGYFMVEKTKLDLAKTTKKLLLPLLFASVCLIVASTVFYKLNTSDVGSYNSLLSNRFNNNYWFFGYYLAIIVVANFLNTTVGRFNKNQYIAFLLVLFSLASLVWPGALLNSLANGLRTMVMGVGLFYLGGFIKHYNPFSRLRLWTLFAIPMLIFAFIILTYYNDATRSLEIFKFNTQDLSTPYSYCPIAYEDWGIIPIILAVCLFELMRRTKIHNSRIINFVAGSTFMVYLLHDNPLFYNWWRKTDWISLLYSNPCLYIINLFKTVVLSFAIGFLGYMLYVSIGKLCSKLSKVAFKDTMNN